MIAGLDASGRVTHDLEDVAGEPGVIDVMDPENLDYSGIELGELSASAGKAAVEWVLKAGEMAAAGQVPGHRDRSYQQGSGKYGRVQGHRPHGDLPEPDELERGSDDAHGRRAARRPPHDAQAAPHRL